MQNLVKEDINWEFNVYIYIYIVIEGNLLKGHLIGDDTASLKIAKC